jgi:hypothetical protein
MSISFLYLYLKLPFNRSKYSRRKLIPKADRIAQAIGKRTFSKLLANFFHIVDCGGAVLECKCQFISSNFEASE